jgi:hypothetical protein
MDLKQTIATIGGKAAVGVVSKKLGLDEQTTARAIDALLPAITGGMQANLAKEGGGAALLGAIAKGDHAKYLDDPETLAAPETVADGNGILGHVLGDKDVSRAVAGKAASALGIDEGITKQVLPVVATMAMGALANQTRHKRSQGARDDDLLSELGGIVGGGDVGSLLSKLF